MSNIQKTDGQKLTMKQVTEALGAAVSVKDALTLPFVEKRFITNFEAVTGRKDGKAKFQDELLAYLDVIEEKPDLKKVDKWFHFSAIIKAGRTGLSFKDNKLYVIPHGAGLKVQASPAGKREQFEMMENVKRVPEPVLVMRGDKFVVDKLNGTVKIHESTEKSEQKITLDNIFASYTRIYWKDKTITDVVVYHDDLVKARSKTKAKSEEGFWHQWPGEAAKKVSINRAFRLFHKYPDAVETLGDRDDDEQETTTDVTHTEVDVVITPSGNQVDPDTGEEVTHDTEVLPETPVKEDKPKTKKKPRDEEEQSFT